MTGLQQTQKIVWQCLLSMYNFLQCEKIAGCAVFSSALELLCKQEASCRFAPSEGLSHVLQGWRDIRKTSNSSPFNVLLNQTSEQCMKKISTFRGKEHLKAALKHLNSQSKGQVHFASPPHIFLQTNFICLKWQTKKNKKIHIHKSSEWRWNWKKTKRRNAKPSEN